MAVTDESYLNTVKHFYVHSNSKWYAIRAEPHLALGITDIGRVAWTQHWGRRRFICKSHTWWRWWKLTAPGILHQTPLEHLLSQLAGRQQCRKHTQNVELEIPRCLWKADLIPGADSGWISGWGHYRYAYPLLTFSSRDTQFWLPPRARLLMHHLVRHCTWAQGPGMGSLSSKVSEPKARRGYFIINSHHEKTSSGKKCLFILFSSYRLLLS